MWGNGRQIRTWTYVSDIVEGTIIAAERIDDGAAVNLGMREDGVITVPAICDRRRGSVYVQRVVTSSAIECEHEAGAGIKDVVAVPSVQQVRVAAGDQVIVEIAAFDRQPFGLSFERIHDADC